MRATCRAAALLGAAVLTALPILPAGAHDELTAVRPEPGSVLTTAPEEVELSFSGEVVDIGHQVRVTDSEGASVTDGPPEPAGNRVVQPLADTGGGDETYDVVWRVVSGDGHPIEGSFSYDVGAGAESATDTVDRGEDPGGPVPAPASEDVTAGAPLWLVAVLGAAAAVAVLGAVSAVSRRRRRG